MPTIRLPLILCHLHMDVCKEKSRPHTAFPRAIDTVGQRPNPLSHSIYTNVLKPIILTPLQPACPAH